MPPRRVTRKSSKKPSRKGSKKNFKMPSGFCAICKRNLKNKKLLNQHHAKHHYFRHCPNCPKTFKRTRKFILHLRSHLEDHPYECKNCLESFNQKKDLFDHKVEEKSCEQFSCEHCGEVFFFLPSLNRHRMAHKGPPYPCNDCGSVFSNISDRTVHSRNHVHRCILCPKEIVAFRSNVDLATHMYTDHQQEEYDPAESEAIEPCVSTGAVNLEEDSASDSMEDLLSSSDLESDSDLDSNHQKDAVEPVYNLKRKDKFICFICYDLYPSCKLLKCHMKAHHWYPCNSCPRFFADAETLKKHECGFAEVPSFRCENCNSVCKNCKTVDDIAEVNVNALPEKSPVSFTDYANVAQRDWLRAFIHKIKSQEGPLDFDSLVLVGFHNTNLKIMLKHPDVNHLFSKKCFRDLEELHSKFQDLSQSMVVKINSSSMQ